MSGSDNNIQRWSPRGRPWPRGRPRGHILKSLALASSLVSSTPPLIILSQKYSTSISTQIICQQIAVLWLCTLRKQCTYCIIVSKLQFNCSIDVTVDNLDRFDLLLLLFFFFFFLRLTICPVVNFFFLHRHSSEKLVFAISFPFQLNFIYIFSF